MKKSDIGLFLRNKRKEKELTQTKLSNKMEIYLSYLNDIEKGRRNPRKQLLQFSKYLKADINYLYYLNGLMPPFISNKKLSEKEFNNIIQYVKYRF